MPFGGVAVLYPAQRGGIDGDVINCELVGRMTRPRQNAQLNLVLHIRNRTLIAARIGRIVVCDFIVNIHGLVWSVEDFEISVRRNPIVGVVIHHNQQVVVAVVKEHAVEFYRGPFVGKNFDISAEHEVGGGDGHPVG